MNTIQIPKQIMEFNKSTFDNNFKAMMLMQDQTQRLASSFVEKAAWLPDEGKKAINDWMKSYQKGVEGFKAASDESYKIISQVFSKSEEVISKAQKSAEK
jgi:hypothetical protein